MKQKTETKLKAILLLVGVNLGVWNLAYAKFEDWKKEIAPGLAVLEQKGHLESFYIPDWMYEPTFESETMYEANNEQGLNTEEIKDDPGLVEAEPEVKPRWVQEINSPVPSEEEIKLEIEKVFGDKAEEAKLICGCESRYQVDIWGDTTTEFKSVGLFQVRELPKRMEMYGLTTKMLEDYKTNIHMAKIIYDRAGDWSPWRNCGLKYNLIK
jgi:hypothetical protein